MSLLSRAGPCPRGQTGPCPPGARLEGESPPTLLPLSLPGVCQACSQLGTHTHSVHDSGPHTHCGPFSPALTSAHPPSHSHSCTPFPLHTCPPCTHTHTLMHIPHFSPPCVHPHLYAPICSHPSQTSICSHLGQRHTPTGSHPHSETLLCTVHAPARPWFRVPF